MLLIAPQAAPTGHQPRQLTGVRPQAPARRASACVTSAALKLPYRIGHGFDLHRLEEGPQYKLIIGGVTIPHNKGFVAHSDGACAWMIVIKGRAPQTVVQEACSTSSGCVGDARRVQGLLGVGEELGRVWQGMGGTAVDPRP